MKFLHLPLDFHIEFRRDGRGPASPTSAVPTGLDGSSTHLPRVETRGYSRSSLRDWTATRTSRTIPLSCLLGGRSRVTSARPPHHQDIRPPQRQPNRDIAVVALIRERARPRGFD